MTYAALEEFLYSSDDRFTDHIVFVDFCILVSASAPSVKTKFLFQLCEVFTFVL